MRVQLAMRNKMFFFFSVVMPLGFFFLYSGIFAKGEPRAVLYFLGPVVALSVMGSFWGLSSALVTFREQGILRRFHVTPVTSGGMLASSIIANYVLALPTVAVELGLAYFVFHVRNMGDVLAVFILVTVGTISFGALGLVIASVTNTMQETQVINQIIWLPLIFLSGATLPLAYLPKIVQKIAAFLPATYLVTGLQKAFYQSTPAWRLLIEIASLAFWAVLAFAISSQLFRWESESKIPRRAKLWAASMIVPFLLLGLWENQYGAILIQAQAMYKSVSVSDNPAPPKSEGMPQGMPHHDAPQR
jgi:ABC-type multidrug transport system permease subunit